MAFRDQGYGQGLTFEDLLVFGDDGPIDNELRFPEECARHKILDLIGDTSLIGCDIQAHIIAHRSGHQLNAALVQRLLEEYSQQRMKNAA